MLLTQQFWLCTNNQDLIPKLYCSGIVVTFRQLSGAWHNTVKARNVVLLNNIDCPLNNHDLIPKLFCLGIVVTFRQLSGSWHNTVTLLQLLLKLIYENGYFLASSALAEAHSRRFSPIREWRKLWLFSTEQLCLYTNKQPSYWKAEVVVFD